MKEHTLQHQGLNSTSSDAERKREEARLLLFDAPVPDQKCLSGNERVAAFEQMQDIRVIDLLFKSSLWTLITKKNCKK